MNSIPAVAEIAYSLAPLFEDERMKLAVLFGSVATERQHGCSDIDLAFLFDGELDIIDLTNRVIAQLKTDRIDVVDLRHASPLLKISVVRSGKLLYQKSPGLFTQFISQAFRMYADSKKLRDARSSVIEKFLAEKGLI